MTDIHAYFIPTKALLVSLVALSVVVLARRASAAKRHAIAVAALLSLVLLPFVGRYVPSRSIVVPPSIQASASSIGNERVPVQSVTDYGAVGVSAVPAETSAVTPPGPMVELWLWLAVSFVLLIRLAVGVWTVSRWSKAGQTMRDGIVRSERVNVPMSAWLGRPLILLPLDSGAWASDRLKRVLDHEEAHVQRKDWLWNLLGQIVCAVYWPVPTVWILQRIAKRAAEQACDDRVLKAGATPSDYADDLLSAAKRLDGATPAVALPLITKGELVSRIRRILDPKVNRGPLGLVAAIATVLCALGVCVVLAGTRFRMDQHSGGTRNPIVRSGPLGYYQPFPQAVMLVPGSKATGFVGQLGDAHVRLVEIQHFTGKRIQAWTPDGRSIPNPPVYGPAPCNKIRGRFALVWQLDGPLPFPDALRGTINYYDAADFKAREKFLYFPESRRGNFMTLIKVTPSGLVLGQNNGRLADIEFNPTERPHKSEMWLQRNGFAGPGSSLSFRVPPNSQIAPVFAVDKQGGQNPARDVRSDAKDPLKVTYFFNIAGSRIDRFNVDVHSVMVPVEFTGINKDAILAQAKEEGE